MKNIFRILMAVAVLLTASCAKEDISSTIGSGEVEVSFTANLADLGTRAYGNAEKINNLRYYVFDQNNEPIDGLNANNIIQAETPGQKYYTVHLTLIKGMQYKVLFWADNGGQFYNINPEAGTVTVNYVNAAANDESRDAFYFVTPAFDPATADDRITNVTLKRPFAQLNVITKDYAQLAKSGVELTKSKVVGYVPTTLNVFDGTLANETAEVTFDFAGIPTDEVADDGQTPLSMNYILAPADQKFIADITIYYEGSESVNFPAANYSNIPLKRNYKTNIIGNLLTASTDFTVTIDANFGTPDETVATDALSLQEAINKAKDGVASQITLGGNIDLNENSNLGTLSTRAAVAPALTIPADKNIVLDLNGYTLTYSASVWNNNMIQNYGELTIENGNVVYTFVGEPDTSYGSGNYAIVNSGDLTINANITVQYKEETSKVSHALYAINAGDGNITINGGTIYNKNNHAVRIWGSTESTFTVNDGTIKGARAIWMQLPNSDTTKAPKVTVNIKGGNLIATGETGYKLAIYSYTHGNSLENVKFNITGGTFDGDIALSGGSNKEAVETVTISGGTFTDVYSYGDSTKAAEKISITGGTFASLAPLAYLNNANEIVTLNSNIENAEPVSFKGEGTLNLNGKSVSTVDTTEKAFELINNSGKLTIVGEGTLSVNATINSGWNRRSSVISNCPGGNLTVQEGVVIEHRGGTDMAYGIDNLTNGKGTYAVTTLNGATVKSTYSAVRQFLNGIEATNELYVNAGTTLESTNRAIYFQDPSKNPNTGKLVVDAEASVTGKVHLDVTAGSTEWPVEVSVASAALKGGSKVTWENLPAGYSVTEQDGVWTVNYSAAAKIGDAEYGSLQQAIEAVQSGETIVLQSDITFTTGANGSTNGISYTKDANFTLDLNGKTITSDLGNNALRFKIGDGNDITGKEVTIEIKNGKIVSGSNNWCAISAATADNSNNKLTLNLNNLVVENSKAGDYAIKSWEGAIVKATNVTITSTMGGAFYAAGGEMVLENCTVDQKGLHTAPYMSMAIAVSSNGKLTVTSGSYKTEPTAASEGQNQGTSHGSWCAGVMNSGGELIINGGTFANGNFGDDALATAARGLLLADTGAILEINGGTFNALKAIVDVTNNLGDTTRNPSVTLTGGNFSADPRISGLYASHLISVAEGYMVKEVNDRFTVEEFKPAAKVGNTEYGSINEAIDAWTNNATLTLLSDVTLSDVVTLNSTEHHILDLGTYTMTAASGKDAFVIKACGTGDAERTAITIKADANNPGGINAGNKSIVYYKYADGGIAGNDRPIIKIEGGVFTASTSGWGTAGIYTIGTAARKCATLNISGGTFNCSINGSGKSKLLISGGLFHYSVGSQGDSTALRLISGGTFKTLGFMTADSNNTKFWFGTSMGNSNVGLYIDDKNYLVVGGPVITEFGDKFAAKATNATKWSSYLQYSSAAANGLYYIDADMAIAKHGEANVVLK